MSTINRNHWKLGYNRVSLSHSFYGRQISLIYYFLHYKISWRKISRFLLHTKRSYRKLYICWTYFCWYCWVWFFCGCCWVWFLLKYVAIVKFSYFCCTIGIPQLLPRQEIRSLNNKEPRIYSNCHQLIRHIIY